MATEQSPTAKSKDKTEPKRGIVKTILVYCGKPLLPIFKEVHNVIQMFVWGDYYREGRSRRRRFSRRRV
jgi:hypothetical protein